MQLRIRSLTKAEEKPKRCQARLAESLVVLGKAEASLDRLELLKATFAFRFYKGVCLGSLIRAVIEPKLPGHNEEAWRGQSGSRFRHHKTCKLRFTAGSLAAH